MNETNLSFCAIVPCYELHANCLEKTLVRISQFLPKIIVIDDGSSTENAQKIKTLTEKFHATLIVNTSNGGKGAAITLGLLKASELNFTHAIQIDSDGQHDIEAVTTLIQLARENPTTLISGRPVYDETVPMGRKLGRYLTHIWVWIETLSLDIVDSMCGFRAYPLESTVKILKRVNIGKRMDFDPEIMVRYYWAYGKVKFFPLRVIYPENGQSYFQLFDDNWLITKMHTKLFFGMLWRFPKLIIRKLSPKKWNQSEEKGTVAFIKFSLWFHKKLGDRASEVLLAIISFYYSLFAVGARKSSVRYRDIYYNYCERQNIAPKKFSPFTHIKAFAKMFLDKLSVWQGSIEFNQFDPAELEKFRELYDTNKGALFISSHYGNLEVLRALGKLNKNIKFNALIYTKNSKKLFNILRKIDPEVEKSIIPIQDFGPEVGALLSNKVQQGEWVFCMGGKQRWR